MTFGLLELGLGSIIIFLGAIVQGVLGFGFGLLAIPFLIIFFDPKFVVPMMCLLGFVLNVNLFISTRSKVVIGRMWPLFVSAAGFLYVGTYLLRVLPKDLMKLVVGVVVLISGVIYLTGFRRRVERDFLVWTGVGALSGALTGAIGIGGPPLIIFMVNQGIDKAVFRANLVAYFSFLGVLVLPMFYFQGLLDETVVRAVLLFLPAMLLGAFLGTRLLKRVPESFFFKSSLGLLVFLGFFLVTTALRKLL